MGIIVIHFQGHRRSGVLGQKAGNNPEWTTIHTQSTHTSADSLVTAINFSMFSDCGGKTRVTGGNLAMTEGEDTNSTYMEP